MFGYIRDAPARSPQATCIASGAIQNTYEIFIMVYLPPPQLQKPGQLGYEEIYQEILTTHRCSPLSSASSLIMLVAPDVDALCAARMFADLLKQDDIMHRIIPVSGIYEFERIKDEMLSNAEVRFLYIYQMYHGDDFDLCLAKNSHTLQLGCHI